LGAFTLNGQHVKTVSEAIRNTSERGATRKRGFEAQPTLTLVTVYEQFRCAAAPATAVRAWARDTVEWRKQFIRLRWSALGLKHELKQVVIKPVLRRQNASK
jgi:hypothetical protein